MQGDSPIDRNDSVIDSRDIIARIEWISPPDNRDEEEELAALKALAAECQEINSEWEHGVTLVADSYFEDHIREETIECNPEIHEAGRPSYNPKSVRIDWSAFPFNYVDWERLADDKKSNHSQVTYDGRTFWLRDE